MCMRKFLSSKLFCQEVFLGGCYALESVVIMSFDLLVSKWELWFENFRAYEGLILLDLLILGYFFKFT